MQLPHFPSGLSVERPRRVLPLSFICLMALCLFALCCTNYSGDSPTVNPPILLALTSPQDSSLAIEKEGTGHILHVRALNQELGFSGYRLYAADSEAAVRALGVDTGSDCGALNLTPIASVEYIIEAKPGQSTVTAGAPGQRLCAIDATLRPGQWILLRSLIYKSPTSVGTSTPSNTAQVP